VGHFKWFLVHQRTFFTARTWVPNPWSWRRWSSSALKWGLLQSLKWGHWCRNHAFRVLRAWNCGSVILTESDFLGPFWHERMLSKLGIHVVQRVMHLSDG
jgi:hypothetical protein